MDRPISVRIARMLQPTTEARPPRLLDGVRAALRARHYSPRTEDAYVGWIRRFILFHGKRHPKEMGEIEVNDVPTAPGGRGARLGLDAGPGARGAAVPLREVLGRPVADLEGVVRARTARSGCPSC